MKNENGIEKSAILKGNTKLVSANGQEFDSYFTINDKIVKGKGIDDFTGGIKEYSSDFATIDLLPLPKPPFIISGNGSWKKIVYYDKDKQFIESRLPSDGEIIDENPSNAKYCRLGYNNTEIDASFKLLKSDGSELDYPNLELISVKLPVLTTTGKNLFNPKWLKNTETESVLRIEDDGSITLNGSLKLLTWFYLDLPKGTYQASSFNDTLNAFHVFWTDTDGFFETRNYFTLNEDTRIKGYIIEGNYDNYNIKLQLETGTQKTSYEPYKSNILTVNEPIELRGIGNVRDTLNCLTGEVVKRIDEIVLDDTLSYERAWGGVRDTETDYVIGVKVNNHLWNVNNEERGSLIKCDKLRTRGKTSFNGYGYFLFYVSKSVLGEELTNAKIREYILSLNATVQYPLATESIKTVDLIIQDQDNQPQERMK